MTKDIRLNRHDEPYKSIQAAAVGARHLKKNKGLDSKPVPIDGGFGLEVEVADEENAKPRRPKRTKIGTRSVLTAPKRDGYERRFVNIDKEKGGWDRIEGFKGAGWSIVEGDVEIGDKRIAAASQMGKAVIRNVGGGVKGILMEIKQDWLEEDQAERQAEIDEQESGMLLNINNPGEGQYGQATIV